MQFSLGQPNIYFNLGQQFLVYNLYKSEFVQIK